MNDAEYRNYLQSEKWKRISYKRMQIDKFKCCMCGSDGTSVNRLQVHHMNYKCIGNEEPRIYQDLLTLCESCHKAVHRMMNRVTDEFGKRGWKDTYGVPRVHVFTTDGSNTNIIYEENIS